MVRTLSCCEIPGVWPYNYASAQGLCWREFRLLHTRCIPDLGVIALRRVCRGLLELGLRRAERVGMIPPPRAPLFDFASTMGALLPILEPGKIGTEGTISSVPRPSKAGADVDRVVPSS